MKLPPLRISRYILIILVLLVLTLLLIQLVMKPPAGDLITLAIYLSITALGSAIFGFVSHRLGWWRRLPRLSYALVLGYVLAGGLTLFNVWLTARLMFINEHDLALGSLLLLFAGGISVAFGYFLSSAITKALETLVQGAVKLSEGDFSTRVPVSGEDEIARLSMAFNDMAARLEQATEAERELEETRRNLVAWASHDLRTPLTSLRAMIDALTDGVVDEPEMVARYLSQSQIEIERMSTLIDDLFELAQLDSGHLKLDFAWMNLSDLVSDTLESFAARAEKQHVALKGVVSPEVDPVWAAPDKLSRILDNLLGNALRYIPEEGEIHLHALAEEDHVLVKVEDTGSGISPKDLPHIFDRFYRGEQSQAQHRDPRSGSGLGLAIVKGLVEAHDGSIGVESELGSGSTFWFTVPSRAGKPDSSMPSQGQP
jgi:signal transduction histidine kinase